MPRLLSKFGCCLLAMIITSVLAPPTVAAPQKSQEKKVLKFSEVQEIARRHFAAIDGYQPGDLITRESVAALFTQLDLYGWKVADKNAILELIISDSDFLAKQLRTERGKQFMRKIGSYPEGFDRVDRISGMPQGRGNVAQMIKIPDGYKMIEAMTTTSRGRILGERLSNAPKGKNFNKPTGRIYTEAALVARLKTSFANRAKTKSPAR